MYSNTQLLTRYLPELDNIISNIAHTNIHILINILLAKPETASTHGIAIIQSVCSNPLISCRLRTLCILLLEHSTIVKCFFQQNECIINFSEQITADYATVQTLIHLCIGGIYKDISILKYEFSNVLVIPELASSYMEKIFSNSSFFLIRKDSVDVSIASLVKYNGNISIIENAMQYMCDFINGNDSNIRSLNMLVTAMIPILPNEMCMKLLNIVTSQPTTHSRNAVLSINVMHLCIEKNILLDDNTLLHCTLTSLYSAVYALAQYRKTRQDYSCLQQIDVSLIENYAQKLDEEIPDGIVCTNQTAASHIYTLVYIAYPERQISDFQLTIIPLSKPSTLIALEALLCALQANECNSEWCDSMLYQLKVNSHKVVIAFLQAISNECFTPYHPIEYIFHILDNVFSNDSITK